MAYVLADRVKETTTSTGTGNLTLAGAVTGFRTFSSVMLSGDCFTYAVVNSTGSEWEVGLGTLSGSNVLVRGTLFASSTGSTINFSAGTKNVFITQSGANQFNVFDDQQSAVETPVDTSNGYLRRQYIVPNLAANTSAQSILSQSTYSSSAAAQFETYYGNRQGISGLSTSAGVIDLTYLNTVSSDWNWTGSTHALFLNYMGFSGSATNGVTSDASGVSHQFWQAYNGPPTFDYWDAPSTTFFPVTTGDIMVGDGSTVPKWYRRTTTGWEPFGVAKITAGTGISVTNNGVGEVTISAGSPPPVVPAWYSYLNDPAPPASTLPVPSDWTAVSGYTMWVAGQDTMGGMWAPQPYGPAWIYNTTNSLGDVYDATNSANVVDPTTLNNAPGVGINVRMFIINPAAYGNTSSFNIATSSVSIPGFGGIISDGGWPVFGASQNGFGCVKVNGGDFTTGQTAVTCTIVDSYYYAPANYTLIFFTGTAADVNSWSGFNPIISLTTGASWQLQLWYTYT